MDRWAAIQQLGSGREAYFEVQRWVLPGCDYHICWFYCDFYFCVSYLIIFIWLQFSDACEYSRSSRLVAITFCWKAISLQAVITTSPSACCVDENDQNTRFNMILNMQLVLVPYCPCIKYSSHHFFICWLPSMCQKINKTNLLKFNILYLERTYLRTSSNHWNRIFRISRIHSDSFHWRSEKNFPMYIFRRNALQHWSTGQRPGESFHQWWVTEIKS
jgi:hypothetical protein